MVPELLVEIQTKASDRAIREAFVKVKFSDFTRTSCQRATAAPDTGTFLDLLAAAFRRNPNPVRLLGVGVRFQLEREAEPEWSYQPTLGL
jgi:DNA polymerase-4